MVTGEAIDDKLERLGAIVERLADQVAQLTATPTGPQTEDPPATLTDSR
jgi:hypothetical protein